MGLNKFVGTPFQITKLPNPEGNRHRSRCIYHRKDGKSDYCGYRFGRCMGSAHCDYYKDKTEIKTKPQSTCDTIKKRKNESPNNTAPSIKKLLIGEKMISQHGEIGEIVDVQRQVLFVKMSDDIKKVGFSALKNPSTGRWKALDHEIQLLILHCLENQIMF